MARPPIVTLRLTVPRMGDQARARGGLEARLIRDVQARLYGVQVDGLYGCETSRAVQSWQWRAGSANTSGAITPEELLVLLGHRPRPDAWKVRTARRLERPGVFRPIPSPVKCTEPTPTAIRLIPRSAVGLRPPRGRSLVTYRPGTPIVVHWQGPGRGAVGLAAAFVQLRGFQAYHMDAHGWSDVGYNLAIPRGVDPGVVIELRGLGVRGAHSGHNLANAYPGILVMTGDGDAGPDPGQLLTLELLRSSIGHGRRTGHLEWSPTSCPGPVLWPWIKAHR